MINPGNGLDDKIFNALEVLTIPPRRRLSLELFSAKYLPFFTLNAIPKEHVNFMLDRMSRQTGAEHTERDLIGNLISEWFSEIGNPYIECDIVNKEGKIVYTIPPLFDQSREAISDGQANVSQLIEQVANNAKVHHQLGVNHMNKHLLPLVTNPHYSLQYFEMWNKVFAYHDLPLYDLSAYGIGEPTEKEKESPDGIKVEDGKKFDADGFEIIDDLDY